MVQDLLPHAHIFRRLGTREQAVAYCRKEDTQVAGPWTYGSEPTDSQGARSDLLQIKRKIEEGATDYEIAEEFFPSWTRYYKSFREYSRICTPPRDFKSYTTVFWGPPGTGKSQTIQACAGPDAWWASKGTTGGYHWFDGYQGQADVVFDDFYGSLPFHFLLTLIDAYPMYVEHKGGSSQWIPARIWFSSNSPPINWYTNTNLDLRALTRRLDRVIFCPSLGELEGFEATEAFKMRCLQQETSTVDIAEGRSGEDHDEQEEDFSDPYNAYGPGSQ